MARRPELGEDSRPDELERLAHRETIYLGGPETEEPKVDVDRIEDSETPLWRVDIDQRRRSVRARLGDTARRKSPGYFLEDLDESVSVQSNRPDWTDVLYSPRLAPQRETRTLRRLDGDPLDPLEVFGTDDRRVFRDQAWPWGLVGRIFTSAGWTGSGVLVGDRLVATAGHVVPWDDARSGSWWMRFVPAYYDGVSLHGSGVESYTSDVRGYDPSGEVAGYDWAIMRLYRPLGRWLGYFGFNGYSSSWNDEPYWSVIGYPGAVAGAQRPSFQNSIDIFDVDSDSNGGKELESQTSDLSDGNSGGPIFGWWGNDPRVVGVVSGAESDYQFPFGSKRANVKAAGSGFTSLLQWGRTNWPG